MRLDCRTHREHRVRPGITFFLVMSAAIMIIILIALLSLLKLCASTALPNILLPLLMGVVIMLNLCITQFLQSQVNT